MTRWIIGTSLKLRRLVLAIAVALLAVGFIQLQKTPMEALPEFSPTRVQIQTESLGLSAEEVEQLITTPMEQTFFNGLPWLNKITPVRSADCRRSSCNSTPAPMSWPRGRSFRNASP
jgi:Cu/Ag efflux pump CusA